MASISLIFLLLSALLDFGYSLSTAPIKIRKGRSLPPEMNVSPASTLVPRRGVLSTIVASAASLAVPKISLADAQIEALPFQSRPSSMPLSTLLETYPPQFTTYLSRFLLTFSPTCQSYWYSLRLPPLTEQSKINDLRLQQFRDFAGSVELSLSRFAGPAGPATLYSLLSTQYPSSTAQRHVLLLFSLLQSRQPTQLITEGLARYENSTLKAVNVTNSGEGYTEAPPLGVAV